MKQFFILFIGLFSLATYAQVDNVPQDYFEKPLDIPLILSGTFGELRSNHFHAGLDIKTQGRQGLEVKSSAKGYVSRIKIQHYGYGKALYIQHPNGYTTVYGHLQKLSPKIEAYLKERQYSKESYEIELFPEPAELPVEQGELIAFSGNTGGSGGPHVHFEIRDGSQRPMNPEMFGIDIEDNRDPIVDGLFAYPIGEGAHVNNSANRQKLRLIPQNDGSYTTNTLEACGEIGFGISTVDQKSLAPNKNGVYKIEASLNGSPVINLDFQRISFGESRYLNFLIDYEYYSNHRKRVQKLFKESNNPLSIYNGVVNEGKLEIEDGLDYNYVVEVKDFKGNSKTIRIPIKGNFAGEITPKDDKTTDYFTNYNETFSIQENGIDIYIPKNALYYDTFLDIQFMGDTVKVHHNDVPLHKNMTIGFDVSDIPEAEKEKLFIARINSYGRPSYSTTYKKPTRFTTGTRTFGEYTLVADVTPPSIRPVNFSDGQWISSNSTLKVKISDDLSGIQGYRATVNGKFILMEYEYKNNTLTHDFSDGVITETENNFKLIVTDNVGNVNIYEAKFFRKN
ncbi:M23 family metallopeptidase [Zunongwangia sp. HRR-M8]|uniref:M23 family metallopeptidase n=1 Tax=Zunongwangia sp. HRR-M8 TaxID=3015170 RepID=UPI0022DD36C9|nr:M23 family metallopeptidase [Zunongwangia sp. HRR-M8]WBL23579.1 M23 family metallopeptidase [Zunongwangia sp. HRR-M8]